MFFIKKLITSFILPPGILIIAFFLIAILERKKKFIFFLSIFFVIFIYLISIEPFKDLILSPLESYYRIPEKIDAEAIVVLGGGKYDNGFLKEDSMNRLLTAYFVHKKTNLLLILSGGAVEGKIPESKVMSDLLKKLGIEDNKIIEESLSRDTSENAFFVEKICRERKIKKVILVTSGYHMKRAVTIFKKTNLNVIPYPTDFKNDLNYNIYSFLPKFSTFAISIRALREHIAINILMVKDYLQSA